MAMNFVRISSSTASVFTPKNSAQIRRLTFKFPFRSHAHSFSSIRFTSLLYHTPLSSSIIAPKLSLTVEPETVAEDVEFQQFQPSEETLTTTEPEGEEVLAVVMTSRRRQTGNFQIYTSAKLHVGKHVKNVISTALMFSSGLVTWGNTETTAFATENVKMNRAYDDVGEVFELGIQLSYLLLLLGLLGVGTFFVIRQVLVRRELDLSAKELQEQVRSGDASSMELFELGAVMLRRKFYPAATKYLLQAIDKWDGDDQDLAQVYNALGVSYVRDGKTDKGISQLETAVKIQPGYVTAWNNLGDAYEKKKEYKSALRAFEEALLFDPNNKIARPRRDALKEKVQLYKDVPLKSSKQK